MKLIRLVLLAIYLPSIFLLASCLPPPEPDVNIDLSLREKLRADALDKNPGFIIGVGEAETENVAKNQARQELVEQILVGVSAENKQIICELAGVEIVTKTQQYGQHYIVLKLNRDQVSNILEQAKWERQAFADELVDQRQKYTTQFPNFLIGVGSAETEKVAKKNAQLELAQQITVKIDSSSERIISEWMKIVKEEFSFQLTTSSNVWLEGAEVVTKKMRNCRHYAVLKLNRAQVPNILTQAKQERAKSKKPLPVKISYTYATGDGKFEPFSEGTVLRSNDRYKLIFEPLENSYVYIFQIDSADKIFRLFPTDKFQEADIKNKNPVRGGEKYWVPAEKKSFSLDDQVGEETIYFMITQEPDPMLEEKYRQLAQSSPDERHQIREEWHQAMKWREPKQEMTKNTQFTWEERGQQFSTTSQYLKNMCDGCVYIVNFQHR